MSKYEALTGHLKLTQGNSYPVSFAEIEAIIGTRLPDSAYEHRAWWSNNPHNSAMTKAWLAAGWYSSNVDMKARNLVFRRGGQAISGFQEDYQGDLPRETLTIHLPAKAVETLRMKAILRGGTFEQLVSDILISAAQLSMKERLAMADRIRSRSPNLHELDLPGMIREDRDTR